MAVESADPSRRKHDGVRLDKKKFPRLIDSDDRSQTAVLPFVRDQIEHRSAISLPVQSAW